MSRIDVQVKNSDYNFYKLQRQHLWPKSLMDKVTKENKT